eukprot:164256-Amphidinium_carterae.6
MAPKIRGCFDPVIGLQATVCGSLSELWCADKHDAETHPVACCFRTIRSCCSLYNYARWSGVLVQNKGRHNFRFAKRKDILVFGFAFLEGAKTGPKLGERDCSRRHAVYHAEM